MLAFFVPLWIIQLGIALALQQVDPSARAAPRTSSETWEELEADYDAAVDAGHAASKKAQIAGAPDAAPSFPVAEFWPRFEAQAARGEGRAILWLLEVVEAVFEDPERRREALERILGWMKKGGGASWLESAVWALAPHGASLDAAAYQAFLDSLDEPANSANLRAVSLLVRALHLEPSDPKKAEDLRLRAACLRYGGRELGDGETLSTEQAEALCAEAVVRYRNESRSWFELAYRESADGSIKRAGAPSDPAEIHRPMIRALADAGSWRAALWVLCNSRLSVDDEPAKERATRYLETVARECDDWEALDTLTRMMFPLAAILGVEAVEPPLRGMVERAPEDFRPKLLLSLGYAVLGTAGGDEAQQERGIGFLSEVAERWPDSQEAQEAAGQIFRFKNLVVGKRAPDFEALDVDGQPFKLSDYKGKVTVIDFWGFW